jgi:hypothetical protein
LNGAGLGQKCYFSELYGKRGWSRLRRRGRLRQQGTATRAAVRTATGADIKMKCPEVKLGQRLGWAGPVADVQSGRRSLRPASCERLHSRSTLGMAYNLSGWRCPNTRPPYGLCPCHPDLHLMAWPSRPGHFFQAGARG